jgi:hypothetical protein
LNSKAPAAHIAHDIHREIVRGVKLKELLLRQPLRSKLLDSGQSHFEGFLVQSFVHFALGQVMDIPLAVHPHRACLTAGRKLHAQVVQNAELYAPAAGRALVPIDPYIVIQAGEQIEIHGHNKNLFLHVQTVKPKSPNWD